jgi:RNA polymerase sigma-70 factor, ECF subfamily
MGDSELGAFEASLELAHGLHPKLPCHVLGGGIQAARQTPPAGVQRTMRTHVPDSDRRDPSDADVGPPDHPDVIALVARAVNRDQAAFGALYERFVLQIFQYLYYRTGDRSVAEDLTEEVFFTAWRALESFRWQGRPFVAWLYGLAHNTNIERLPRGRLPRSFPGEAPDLAIADPAEAAGFERTVDQDVLRDAISRLSPDQQQVIILRFGGGLDTAEIAALMGQDAGDVRLLQMRALQRLRQLLAQDFDRTGDA